MPEYTEEEYEWKKDSLCREYPDLDFINIPNPRYLSAIEKIREVCSRCLVFNECRTLVDAIETPPDASRAQLPSYGLGFLAGIWAGELPRERVRRRCRELGFPVPPWLGGDDEEIDTAEELSANEKHEQVLHGSGSSGNQ